MDVVKISAKVKTTGPDATLGSRRVLRRMIGNNIPKEAAMITDINIAKPIVAEA